MCSGDDLEMMGFSHSIRDSGNPLTLSHMSRFTAIKGARSRDFR